MAKPSHWSEREPAPLSVEAQIVKAAIKWVKAVRKFRLQDHPSGPQLAGRRRAVKLAAANLRKLTSLLIED